MQRFDLEQQIKQCENVLNKAKERTEDRLHNFKVAAGLQGTSPEQALAGYEAQVRYDMCRKNMILLYGRKD